MNIIFKNIRILFHPKEIRLIMFLLVGMIIMAILEVIGIASVIPFISIVSDSSVIHSNKYLSSFYQYFSFNSDHQFLIATGAFLLGVLVISNMFKLFISWMLVSFTTRSSHLIASRLLRLYLNQPYEFYLNRNTSELSKNVLSEVSRAISGVVMPIMESISKFMIIFFIIIGLLIVDPIMAITCISVLGSVYALVYIFVRKNLYSIGVKSTIAISDCFKTTNEAMLGIKELKLYGLESKFYKRFFMPSEKQGQYKARSNIISIIPTFVLETLAFGGIVLIIIVLIGKNQTVGQVIPLLSLYALAGYRLLPALQAIYRGLTNSRYNLPAFNILIKDLSIASSESSQYANNIPVLPFIESIRFNNISFSYSETGVKVVNDMSFLIQSNTTIGLVGTTGAGKTTLIDILLGLLSPTGGQVEIDGLPLTEENIANWQKNIGYVPQDIHLVDATIEENIAFSDANSDINFEKVVEVSKMAELSNFIEHLPNQYKTNIGERGVKLSGGQRQRIGIARALYREPSLIVLDEATSSLDGITENTVMNAIHKLNHQKTIIIIAHRLASLKCCDTIYMLEEGKISDKGSYDELIENNDKFKKMCKTL